MDDETLNDLKDIITELYPRRLQKISSAYISVTIKKFMDKYPEHENALPAAKKVSHES